MVIENKVKTLTITTFLLLAKKVLRATAVSRIVEIFSSTHVLNYFPATPGNTSPDFSDDLTKYHLASLAISPFHNNPYMKVIQAYDAIPPPQAIIALHLKFQHLKTLTLFESPFLVISILYNKSSSPVRSTTSPPDYLFDESIFAELDNSLWIIPRPLGSEPNPEEPNE
ncbi:hypothetical protein Tco_0544860 [Tanacetum coccineum]